MEVTRRLLLVLGLLCGVWTYLELRPVLVAVAVEDFADSKEQAENQMTGFLHREKTLEDFFDSRTEGRLKRVDGEAWTRFYGEVESATVEDAGDEELRRRRGLDYYRDRLFFLPDSPPIDELADSLSEYVPMVYASIGDGGLTAPTLTLMRYEGVDATDKAPAWLVHPRRSWSLWLVLAGLAGYLLLPRPPRGAGVIRYAKASAIVVPDFLAAALLTFFFALPILIASMNGGYLFDLDDGWWLIGTVFWFLAIGPLVLLVITTRNAAFSLRMTEDSLELTRWSGRRRIAYDSIETVEGIEWRTPGWLKGIARLTTLFTWRGGLPALMLEQGRGDGLEIVLGGRRTERIWLSSLLGWEDLVEELERRGVKVSDVVRELARRSRES